MTLWPNGERFHSLQTGKRITRHMEAFEYLRLGDMFQFPSNGKAYHKQNNRRMHEKFPEIVSIPFKRESVSQANRVCSGEGVENRFNSLQTGKRITRVFATTLAILFAVFQFPSNGKAYHKNPHNSTQSLDRNCFNSLQTGKRITSRSAKINPQSVNKTFQFPSNGKAYHKLPISRWQLCLES